LGEIGIVSPYLKKNRYYVPLLFTDAGFAFGAQGAVLLFGAFDAF
jgi:hypothetical protein